MTVSSYSLIINLFLLLGVLVFWNFLYKDYILDHFRQRVFELRAELFDMAANPDCSINFNSDIYVLLRSIYNGSIRFGQSLSFSDLLLFGFLNKKTLPYGGIFDSKNRRSQKLKATIEDTTVRKKIDDLERRYIKSVSSYLLFSSFTAMVVMVFVFISIMAKGIFSRAGTFSPRAAVRETERELQGRIRIYDIEEQAKLFAI
jgi:hypothetical protein